MNVGAYLERIRYTGPREPTAAALRDLHVAHLTAVPFENLSIHLREPIVLSVPALFEKIVTRRRGGFCYELNGLFAALLREIGFDVQLLSAGVMEEPGGFGPPFDHMTLLVTLEERWLVDVGFGESFVEPLRFDEPLPQPQTTGTYRIADEDGTRTVLRSIGASEPRPQYRIFAGAHDLGDFEDMSRYHQTSPASHFTQKRLCTLATSDGRMTLSDMRLIESRGESRTERVLSDDRECREVLRDTFGIALPDAPWRG